MSCLDFPDLSVGEVASVLASVPEGKPSQRTLSILAPQERERASAFRNARACAEFCHARLILRAWCSSVLGRPAVEIPISIGRFGAPELAAPYDYLRFSMSHAAGKVMLSMAYSVDVGVDIESVANATQPLALARRVMSDREIALLTRLKGGTQLRAFVRLWTRREAWLKLRRCGFAGNDRSMSMLGAIADTIVRDGQDGMWIWSIATRPGIRIAPIRQLTASYL